MLLRFWFPPMYKDLLSNPASYEILEILAILWILCQFKLFKTVHNLFVGVEIHLLVMGDMLNTLPQSQQH